MFLARRGRPLRLLAATTLAVLIAGCATLNTPRQDYAKKNATSSQVAAVAPPVAAMFCRRGGGGLKGGRGCIEGEPIPLDTSEPKFQDYFNQVRERIKSKWIYPYEASSRGSEGELQIEFGIAKSGELQYIENRQTSGVGLLDDYAMRAVQLASPFPPVPDALSKGGLPINGIFRYHILGAKTTQEPSVKTAVAAASPTTSPVFKPTWAVGDEWSYRWESPRGKGTFVRIVNRFEALDGIEWVVVSSGNREIFYRHSDGAHHLEKVDGVVEVRNTPPVNMMLFPLEVGKTWNPAYTREFPIVRQSDDMLLACRIATEESVTVPAGTFRAFHIVCLNRRSGSLNFEQWYAPEVGNMIKERTRFDYGVRERELLGFKRGETRQ